MLTFTLPMLVSVTSCEVEAPTATFPNSTFVALGTRLGPLTPQPAVATIAIAAARTRPRMVVRAASHRGLPLVESVEIVRLSVLMKEGL